MKKKEIKYANRHGYSDIEPFEIIKTTGKKITIYHIRQMKAELADGWKPEIIPGGFAGHCVNQHTQKYNYSQIKNMPLIKIRQHKNGKWYDKYKNHYVLSDRPIKFYDYNF